MKGVIANKPPPSTEADDSLDITGTSSVLRRKSSVTETIPKKSLFEGDGRSSSDEDSEDSAARLKGESAAFKINEEYARRFEHNKKREELHRCQSHEIWISKTLSR